MKEASAHSATLSFQFALLAMDASKLLCRRTVEARNRSVLFELAASNWFQSRQGIGSSHIHPLKLHRSPVATWRDFGALLFATDRGRNGNGRLLSESTAVRKFCGIA